VKIGQAGGGLFKFASGAEALLSHKPFHVMRQLIEAGFIKIKGRRYGQPFYSRRSGLVTGLR